jgi:hypothetical protein
LSISKPAYLKRFKELRFDNTFEHAKVDRLKALASQTQRHVCAKIERKGYQCRNKSNSHTCEEVCRALLVMLM